MSNKGKATSSSKATRSAVQRDNEQQNNEQRVAACNGGESISRCELDSKFSDGRSPNGKAFADIFSSTLNIEDDGIAPVAGQKGSFAITDDNNTLTLSPNKIDASGDLTINSGGVLSTKSLKINDGSDTTLLYVDRTSSGGFHAAHFKSKSSSRSTLSVQNDGGYRAAYFSNNSNNHSVLVVENNGNYRAASFTNNCDNITTVYIKNKNANGNAISVKGAITSDKQDLTLKAPDDKFVVINDLKLGGSTETISVNKITNEMDEDGNVAGGDNDKTLPTVNALNQYLDKKFGSGLPAMQQLLNMVADIKYLVTDESQVALFKPLFGVNSVFSTIADALKQDDHGPVYVASIGEYWCENIVIKKSVCQWKNVKIQLASGLTLMQEENNNSKALIDIDGNDSPLENVEIIADLNGGCLVAEDDIKWSEWLYGPNDTPKDARNYVEDLTIKWSKKYSKMCEGLTCKNVNLEFHGDIYFCRRAVEVNDANFTGWGSISKCIYQTKNNDKLFGAGICAKKSNVIWYGGISFCGVYKKQEQYNSGAVTIKGGGVHVREGSIYIVGNVKNCFIYNTSVAMGAGVCFESVGPNIPNQKSGISGDFISCVIIVEKQSSDAYFKTGAKGGAISIASASLNLQCNLIRCLINTNFFYGRGGGLYVEGDSNITMVGNIDDCQVYGDEVVRGGGVYCDGGSVSMLGNIRNCRASLIIEPEKKEYASGGAIALTNNDSLDIFFTQTGNLSNNIVQVITETEEPTPPKLAQVYTDNTISGSAIMCVINGGYTGDNTEQNYSQNGTVILNGQKLGSS